LGLEARDDGFGVAGDEFLVLLASDWVELKGHTYA
jgi:hypothetical protein